MRCVKSSWICLGLMAFPAVAMIGCAGTHAVARPHSSEVLEEMPVLWQESGTYSRLRRGVRLVIRDAATLARVPLTEVPVDFQTQMVFVIGMGPTVNNEFGVRISRVWRQDERIRVQERRIHPAPEALTGVEPASPWTVAVVPRSDLNVEGFDTRVPPGLLGQ